MLGQIYLYREIIWFFFQSFIQNDFTAITTWSEKKTKKSELFLSVRWNFRWVDKWFATVLHQTMKRKTNEKKRGGRKKRGARSAWKWNILTCSVIGVYWATALFRSGKMCEAGKSRNSVADALNFQLNVTLFGLASNSHKILIVSWRPPL